MLTCDGGVLIVDDEVLIADYVQMVVEDEGLDVVGVVGSAAEALAVAAERGPSLALVDVNLGEGGDGIELAGRLRAQWGMRVVFLTGSADPATLERIGAVDALGFLQKPFVAAELSRLLHETLAAPQRA